MDQIQETIFSDFIWSKQNIIFIVIVTLILNYFAAALSIRHLIRHGYLIIRQRPPTYSLVDLQTHLPPCQYSGTASNDNCSICLECLEEGESYRALPTCKHVFHAQCVYSWLTRVANCPLCRTPVRLEAGQPFNWFNCNELGLRN